jgi:dolichyl-phosphate beta-glucosyltransferase
LTGAVKDIARRQAGGEQFIADVAGKITGQIELSVVIPTYNEEKRIVNTVSLINHYLNKQDCRFEVIISDDGSRDGGPRLVREKFNGNDRVRLLRDQENLGKGAAVRRGVLAARGDLIIFMDADLSYPVETIEQCMAELESHDIAIGSRNLSDSRIEISPTWLRRLTGPVFKAIVRRLVIGGFTDTQCGFKGFRSQAAHDIFINCSTNGFAFDVEVLALARRFGYSITEMPVKLQLDSSDSQINLTTDAASMVLELLAIRRRMRTLNGR